MSRFIPCLALVAVLSGAAPTSVAAQPTGGTLSVEVRRADNRPVRGAEVVLWPVDGQPRPARVTGDDGKLGSESLPAGVYRLISSAPGFSTVVTTVVVRRGESAEATVVLPDLITEHVTVIGQAGSLDRVPGAAAAIEEVQIARHVGVADVHRILRRLPGVNLQEEEGYGLRPNIGLRGSGSERSSKITLMEDGVLIAPAPYAAPAAYYFPTVARMERLEVVKGSSQLRYGPATTGGVVNLVSAAIPSAFRLHGGLAAGSDDLGRIAASLGDRRGRVGWLVETYQFHNSGFKRLDGGGDTGVTLQDYLGKFRVETTPSERGYQVVDVKLGRTEQTGHETYLGLTDADFARTPFRRYAASREDLFQSTHTQAQVRHLYARRQWDLTTVIYRNGFERAWYKLQSVRGVGLAGVLAAPEAFGEQLDILRGADSEADALVVRNNNRRYYGAGVETAATWRASALGVRHELRAGLRYHRDEEDRLQHDDGYRMTAGRMLRTSSGAPGSQDNRVGDARAVAAFVSNVMDRGRWTITPGLRVEAIRLRRTDYARDDPARGVPIGVRTNELTVVIPGIGLTYVVAPELSLFGGVHRGFAPPGPGSTEETDAERSVAYEFGARVTRPRVRAEVAAFVSDYDNLLGRDTLSSGGAGTGDQFNGGRALVRGMEVAFSWDPAPRVGDARVELPVHVAYTFTAAEFRNTFDSAFGPWRSVTSGDQLPYTPRHQLFTGVELRRGPLAAGVEGVYVGRMRTVAGRGPHTDATSTDAHLVFNLSASWQVRDEARLVASVENLADRRYVVARQPAGARPGLPRQVFVGLSFDLGR